MLFNVKCPSCGSVILFDDSRVFMFCRVCGQKLYKDPSMTAENQPAQPQVQYAQQPQAPVQMPVVMQPHVPVQNVPGSPNLIISFTSEHPRVFLITTILATGQSFQYSHGQSMTFTLTPGIHAIDLKIGKRTYRRDVLINAVGDPVRILASWSRGTARISIMGPQQPGSPPIMYG